MIFGLGAALGWGLADFGAAVAGRKLGSFATLLVAQLSGLVTLVLFAVAFLPNWSGGLGDIGLLAANGVLAAGAYLLLYQGLALGPVALVSPIVAAYGVVTIPLALLLLHETLAGLVALGAIVTVVGVVLTSADPRTVGSGKRMHRDGVPFALGSLLMFGVATFVLGESSQRVGWLWALGISRISTFVVLLALWVLRRPSIPRGGATAALLAAAGVGILDVLGGAAYARGSEVGLVSIVTAASATFPLISVAAGVVLLRERPAISQAFGVALVVLGLLLLGAGR